MSLTLTPFSIILTFLIIPSSKGDDEKRCEIGETWVEQKIKFECFSDDDVWLGVRAVACVPSNVLGGHELMPGDVWSNENFKYKCDRINEYDVEFNVIACFTPTTPPQEMPLNSSLAVEGRGIYKCIMRDDSVVVRRLQAGCVHNGTLHSYASSWISGDMKLTCLWANHSYQVRASACMTEDGVAVDVGSYVMIGDDVLHCEGSETDNTTCALVKVDMNNHQNWGNDDDDSDEASDIGSSGTAVNHQIDHQSTPTATTSPTVEPPSSHTSHEIPAHSAESPIDPFVPSVTTTVTPLAESNTGPAESPTDTIPEAPINSSSAEEVNTVTDAPPAHVCDNVQDDCKDAHPEACKILCSSPCKYYHSTVPYSSLQALQHIPVAPVIPLAGFIMPVMPFPQAHATLNTQQQNADIESQLRGTRDIPVVSTGLPTSNDKIHSCKRLVDMSDHIVQTLCPRACGICGNHIDRSSMARCYVQNICKVGKTENNSY